MAKIDVVCPRSAETHTVLRNDYSGSGAQRYRCKHCLKAFPLSYRYNGAGPDTHQTIADMAVNGSGCQNTAHSLGVGVTLPFTQREIVARLKQHIPKKFFRMMFFCFSDQQDLRRKAATGVADAGDGKAGSSSESRL